MLRKIIKINEDKCNGCGLCIPKCHEGAIQLINGKARLISEFMCDGLGACLGHCPEDAIKTEEREAEPYDERKVMLQLASTDKETVTAHLEHLKDHGEFSYLKEACKTLEENGEIFDFDTSEVLSKISMNDKKNDEPVLSLFNGSPKRMHGTCPGSGSQTLKNNHQVQGKNERIENTSALSHWPVQLHLINPAAPHYRNSDLLIAADCTAYAIPGFHQQFLQGKKLAIACPKLDQGMEVYLDKLISLINEAGIQSITVLVMKVPCCGGLGRLVSAALAKASREVKTTVKTIDFDGSILNTTDLTKKQQV